MDDLTFKTYRAQCKASPEEGVIDAFITMSAPTQDRDEEVIQPAAFKETLPIFMQRPVLLSSHNYGDLRKQIGEFVKIKLTKAGLQAQPKYYINQGNEEADWAYRLAEKNMAAFSVGFIPREWVDGNSDKAPRRTYTSLELLEISQVVVPSNREAIQGVRSKSVDPVEIELLDDVLKDIVTKPEETDDFIRIPVSTGHEDHRIRIIDIDKGKGIKALYCAECKEVTTYLFAKDQDWTMADAKKWVKEHEKAFVIEVEPVVTSGYVAIEDDAVNDADVTYFSVTQNLSNSETVTVYNTDEVGTTTTWTPPPPTETATVSQEEIKDDIDYLVTIFDQDGVVEKDTVVYAWKLVSAILEQAGDDIPDEIRAKLEPIDIAKAVRAAFAQITGG